MIDFIKSTLTVAVGLCGLAFFFVLQLIPLVLSVYVGIWVLDWFGLTNIL